MVLSNSRWSTCVVTTPNNMFLFDFFPHSYLFAPYLAGSIADMYENAHKVAPDNEEILSSLFMSYVRLSDYKKQQQTAMILHRLRPHKNPYYFWAIMSIVMQVGARLVPSLEIIENPEKCDREISLHSSTL